MGRAVRDSQRQSETALSSLLVLSSFLNKVSLTLIYPLRGHTLNVSILIQQTADRTLSGLALARDTPERQVLDGASI